MEDNWDDELSRIGRTLAERAEIISSLPVDRLHEAYQEGQRIAQRLLLIRALMRADLERLNTQASLLRAIVAQAVQPAGPRVLSAF